MNNNLNNIIDGLNGKHLLVLFSVATLLAPGIFILINYFPDLFLKLDIFKIFFICIPLGIVSVIPAFIISAINSKEKKN